MAAFMLLSPGEKERELLGTAGHEDDDTAWQYKPRRQMPHRGVWYFFRKGFSSGLLFFPKQRWERMTFGEKRTNLDSQPGDAFADLVEREAVMLHQAGDS